MSSGVEVSFIQDYIADNRATTAVLSIRTALSVFSALLSCTFPTTRRGRCSRADCPLTVSPSSREASKKVAADGGANRVLQLSKRKTKTQSSSTPGATSSSGQDSSSTKQQWYKDLDAVIGDLDSLSAEAREFFSASSPSAPRSSGGEHGHDEEDPATESPDERRRKCQIIHDPDQYSTDFTKAVRHVRKNNNNSDINKAASTTTTTKPPRDVICLGGLGGRVDQGLSQLHHLYLFQQDEGSYERDGRIYLLSGEGLTFLLQGSGKMHRIHVSSPSSSSLEPHLKKDVAPTKHAFAKHVGILPLREPSVISTKGLEWDVTDWPTEFGGQLSTSNHVVEDVVEITTSKDVLFTIALRREKGYDERDEV